MGNRVQKIVIIGPESTGKSTLCTQLSEHYHTLWCPEYAREYLLQNGTNYTFDHLSTIAKGQLRLEESLEAKVKSQKSEVENSAAAVHSDPFTIHDSQFTKRLFIDTDMYVMKVWCEFVFGDCHQWMLNEIVKRPYDLYLLCKPDLPWVKDELREYPDQGSREKLYHIYKDLLINQTTPWAEISGSSEERMQKAIVAVDTLS